jgi:hypothetical protein
MLFSFITKWAIKRQLKRRQSDGFCPFGGAKRLVLMAQGKDVQSLLPGIQEMVRAGIDVTLVIDTHRKDKVSVEVPGCSPILVLQTCWLLKRPTRAFLRNFDDNDGDVLIDVSISKSLPLLYLAVRSRSIFKIGVPKGESNPFNLQILLPESSPRGGVSEDGDTGVGRSKPNAGELLQSALFYWKKIGVKENNL